MGDAGDILLDIRTLYEFEGSNRPLGWFCKGHVDPHTFREALRFYLHPFTEKYEPLSDARHELWRWVPSGEKGMPSCCQVVKERGRGVFEVTVIYD